MKYTVIKNKKGNFDVVRGAELVLENMNIGGARTLCDQLNNNSIEHNTRQGGFIEVENRGDISREMLETLHKAQSKVASYVPYENKTGEVIVPLNWLERLQELSDKLEKEIDDGAKRSATVNAYMLIGYISSVKHLLKKKDI